MSINKEKIIVYIKIIIINNQIYDTMFILPYNDKL